MTLFDSQNETAYLSLLIQNPQQVYELSKVKDFMMSSTVNQILLSTIQEMSNQNLLPESNLLISTLGTKGKLTDVGGEEYVKYLHNQKYPIENLPQYESLIVDSYKAKKLVEWGGQLVGLANAKDASIQDILVQSDEIIANLLTESSSEKTRDISSVLKDYYKVLQERVESDEPVGIPTGIDWFDKVIGGIPYQAPMVVAGATSMGKTMTMMNMMLGAARSGRPVLYFCPEMGEVPLSERLVGMVSGVDIARLHLGNITQKELDQVNLAIKEIKSLPIYVDSNFGADAQYITFTTKKFKKQKGIEVIFADYIQLLVERDANMTKAIGNVSRKMLKLSEDLNIGLVMGSQLNRGVDSRDDKRPVKTDLKESGDIENDSHLIMMLYRAEVYKKDDPKVKGIMSQEIVKNKVNGICGINDVRVDLPTNRILGLA